MSNHSVDNKVNFKSKLVRVVVQALQWAGSGSMVGLAYGFFKGDILKAINTSIYVVAMLMLFYTIIPVEELAMITRDRNKTYTTKDVEGLRKGKVGRMNKQLWNFLRTAVVFAIAIVLEIIRFRVIGG